MNNLSVDIAVLDFGVVEKLHSKILSIEVSNVSNRTQSVIGTLEDLSFSITDINAIIMANLPPDSTIYMDSTYNFYNELGEYYTADLGYGIFGFTDSLSNLLLLPPEGRIFVDEENKLFSDEINNLFEDVEDLGTVYIDEHSALFLDEYGNIFEATGGVYTVYGDELNNIVIDEYGNMFEVIYLSELVFSDELNSVLVDENLNGFINV